MNLKRIKELSKEKGISIRFLANQTGFTEQTILRMIRENTARIQTIQKIADFLKVPVTYFMEENKEPEKTIISIRPSEINTRLKKVMFYANLNQIQFAGRIGIAQDRFNKILHNNMDFGIEVIQGVASAFPEIDMRWLLLGVGEMEMKTSIAAEPHSNYGRSCKECDKKEKTINNLNFTIDGLREKLNECNKIIEKRKVG